LTWPTIVTLAAWTSSPATPSAIRVAADRRPALPIDVVGGAQVLDGRAEDVVRCHHRGVVDDDAGSTLCPVDGLQLGPVRAEVGDVGDDRVERPLSGRLSFGERRVQADSVKRQDASSRSG
jgi:hypothetical protein